MKKILLILLVLLTPVMVLADSSSPQILGYEAVVINKKGIKVEDGDGKITIPYNTKVYVINEYDGKLEICRKKNYENCYYDISPKDIAPVKKEIVPNDLLKRNEEGTTLEKYNTEIYIYNTKGIKLKKGPSEGYGTYDIVVPYKTMIKVNYAIHFVGHGGGYTWLYVDDGDYKGWVSSDEKVAIYSNKELMLFKDVKFYDVDTKKEITTIPAETVFKETYDGDNIYLTYQDKFGYIEPNKYTDDDVIFNYGYKSDLGYIITTRSIELMDSDLKGITAIPKAERIKILYGSYEDDEAEDYPWHETLPVCLNRDVCLYYIEYNNNKGFIYSDNVIALYHEDKVTNKIYDEDLKVYDIDYYKDSFDLDETKIPLEEYSKSHETNTTLPSGTQVIVYMEQYIFDYSKEEGKLYGDKKYTINLIKYGNVFGWVKVDEEDDRVYEEENIIEPIPSKDKDIPRNFVMNKTTESIINGIMIALIASSVGLSLLLIVNRKKYK